MLLLSSVLQMTAQSPVSVFLTEPILVRNDFGFEIIGEIKDRTLFFRDKFDEILVYGYDNQMKESFSKKLDFDTKGLKILSIICGKNDFSLIYRIHRKGRTTLHINKYDPGANLIDTLTIKDYGERPYKQPNLEVMKSDDLNCVSIFNTAGGKDELEITAFDIDKMQVLWDRSFLLNDGTAEPNKRVLLLGNQGEFFIVSEYNNRKVRSEYHHFKVYGLLGGLERTIEVPMTDLLTSSYQYVFDNKNRNVVFAGLYTTSANTERANGAFMFTVTTPGMSAALKTDEFGGKFVTQVRGREGVDERKGLDFVSAAQLICRNDGGVVLICEKRESINRGVTASRGFFRDNPRLVIDYYYDDMFAVAFEPKGTVHWKSVMQKRQYSQDDDGLFSSFFLMRSPQSLHFLYNDEIRYENTCSEYVIFPDGTQLRRSLLNTADKELRIRFQKGVQVGPRTVIFPSEYKNRLRLVKLVY